MTPGELQAALAKSRAEASGLSQSMIDAGKYVAELRAEVHTLRNAAALATERAEAEVAALRLALHEIVRAYKALVVTEMICADPRDGSDADMTMRKAVDSADSALAARAALKEE